MSQTLAPDFFIVGAPKCGTTALDAYLAAHPSIFMAEKEQHFFGSDLQRAWSRPSKDEYLRSFTGSELAERRGEGSVWYLMSQYAAEEIHAFDPRARIVVMLRNPIDMLPSLHSQTLLSHAEDIEDFVEALSAESDRRQGKRIPPHCTFPAALLYRETVRFKQQLERYLAVFERSQIHVVLFDDFASDTHSAYRGVLDFLGVDSTFAPSLHIVNANKRARSKWVHRQLWELWDPDADLRRIGRRIVPSRAARDVLWRTVTRFNTAEVKRPSLDPAVRASLADELAPDIQELGELLGRDLSHWYAGDGARRKAAPDRGEKLSNHLAMGKRP
jgi:hypothetical protein